MVRLVLEHRNKSESRWAAIVSIGAKSGGKAETRRDCIHKAERQPQLGHALSVDERERLKALARENRERRRAHESWRQAAAFFAQVELDHRGQ